MKILDADLAGCVRSGELGAQLPEAHDVTTVP